MITASRWAAFVSLAALVFCVAASASGRHRAVTGPCAAASFVALAGCLLRLRLKGGARCECSGWPHAPWCSRSRKSSRESS